MKKDKNVNGLRIEGAQGARCGLVGLIPMRCRGTPVMMRSLHVRSYDISCKSCFINSTLSDYPSAACCLYAEPVEAFLCRGLSSICRRASSGVISRRGRKCVSNVGTTEQTVRHLQFSSGSRQKEHGHHHHAHRMPGQPASDLVMIHTSCCSTLHFATQSRTLFFTPSKHRSTCP